MNAHERERNIESLRTDATITDGIIRWNSNGHIPPAEYVRLAAEIGLPVDVDACTRQRNEETAAFFAEYRRSQPAQPSREERFEARAAFGPGVNVVDVISGRRVTT